MQPKQAVNMLHLGAQRSEHRIKMSAISCRYEMTDRPHGNRSPDKALHNSTTRPCPSHQVNNIITIEIRLAAINLKN